MPGDDLHKIQKAATLGVDCICMDLEDGVALNRKAEARLSIRQALGTLDFGPAEKLVRINPVGSGLENDDLWSVLPSHPDGIVIPKVTDGESLRWVGEQIAVVEREQGWPVGSIGMIPLVETARGIVNLVSIAAATMRLQALIFGADDLMGDIGGMRTREGMEVFYARSAVVTYAAAFNLQAIDQVFIDIKDIEMLRKEALQGAQMGFSGKQIIHPSQVAPVQEAYTPSEQAVDYARRVVEADAEHQKMGVGAFVLDGRMIDAPTVKAAERILARARAAGKL
jgi:citrate lyase beta subunit